MIEFHFENEITLEYQAQLIEWISASILKMSKEPGEINYIFCSDDYLLDINQRYLNHDTYTDIISFDYSKDSFISGDIYISTDRVQENATTFGVSFRDELCRVIIHGVLHFKGFVDKTEDDKTIMRKQEDYYLSLRTF